MAYVWQNLDRIIAFAAIIISCVAIWDVHRLFQHQEKRDEATEKRVHEAVLRELKVYTLSYAAFYRATQFIEFFPTQPDRETSIAMLWTFRLQELLFPNGTPEEMKKLRKISRDQMELASRDYAEMLIKSGLGKLKEGFELNDKPPAK